MSLIGVALLTAVLSGLVVLGLAHAWYRYRILLPLRKVVNAVHTAQSSNFEWPMLWLPRGIAQDIGKEVEQLCQCAQSYNSFEDLPHFSLINLSELGPILLQNFRLRADTKMVVFTVEISPTLPLIHADYFLIERALSLLVEDALERCEAGAHIAISFSHASDFILISVRDTASQVVPLAVVSKQPTARSQDLSVDRNLTEKRQRMARQIVLAHGGTFDLHEIAGEGALVKIQLSRNRP